MRRLVGTVRIDRQAPAIHQANIKNVISVRELRGDRSIVRRADNRHSALTDEFLEQLTGKGAVAIVIDRLDHDRTPEYPALRHQLVLREQRALLGLRSNVSVGARRSTHHADKDWIAARRRDHWACQTGRQDRKNTPAISTDIHHAPPFAHILSCVVEPNILSILVRREALNSRARRFMILPLFCTWQSRSANGCDLLSLIH